MRTSSQLLLTFLLNAGWQIALITLAAAFGSWLLRGMAARYRHLLWVIALASSFALPLLTSSHLIDSKSSEQARAPATTQPATAGSFSAAQLIPADTQAAQPAPLQQANSFVPISRNLAALVVVLYLLLLGYRSSKLFMAWRRTRAIAGSAYPVDLPASVQSIISECQAALGISRVRIMCSASVAVPITVGIRAPLVILPERLLQEAERAVLTSAIGHELVHVLRRDYLLNLLYELIALPLAFHPATALLKRRIRETRELGCDELVTDRLLEPAVYARSLVQLAGAAITVGRPNATISVGIADADILEERVMTILNKPKLSLWRKNLLLAAAALVFIVSCVVAAPFALHVSINSQNAADREGVTQEAREKEMKISEAKRKQMRDLEELLKQKAAELEALHERLGATLTQEEEAKLKQQVRRLERQLSELKHAHAQARGFVELQGDELAKLAQISMHQAIQIATAQQPGTVLVCFLRGHREEGREIVLYDVTILSASGAENTTTRVAINAIDGSILATRNEKEKRWSERKQ